MWFIPFLLGIAVAYAYERYAERQQQQVPPPDRLPPRATVLGYSEGAPLVARGDAPVASSTRVLPSPLPGVADAAWTKFVLLMRTQPSPSVTDSNAIGMFEQPPRRLVDLGLVADAKRVRGSSGRMVWEIHFKPPLTLESFLASPLAQYNAFSESMKRYDEDLKTPAAPPPSGMTRSGALAILHRAGPSGLKSWASEKNRFPATSALYSRANGVF